MSLDLQRRGSRESTYERPDQRWVCGWAAEGRPCPHGPEQDGECAAIAECTPFRRGERWYCARSEAFGGTCSDGPLPQGVCCHPIERCQPERSLRAKRGRATRWLAAVTLALLALGFSSERGQRMISPGPLGAPHGLLEENCASCHEAAGGGAIHWLSAAFVTRDANAESQRCIACHNLGESAPKPHSLSEIQLTSARGRAESRAGLGSPPLLLALAGLAAGVPAAPDGALACATCHREHQGREFDLTSMSDTQCQVCHQQQFAAFGDGHPAFSDYPYARRTRIRFDHGTHKTKHFVDRESDPASDPNAGAFECIACHMPESTGANMSIVAYERSCGGCHEGDVRGDGLKSGTKGVAILNLPTLDRKSLSAASLPLGDWPKSKRSKPSPFMDLLLAGDESFDDGDRAVVAGLDPAKLEGASPEELDAVVRYGWAIKRLVADLAANGHAALRTRLERATGRELDAPELADLTAGLPLETLLEAQRRWLPRLEAELELFESASSTVFQMPTAEPDVAAIERLSQALAALPEVGDLPREASDRKKEAWVPAGGWYRTQRNASIRYRSRGHADPFLRSWLDLAGGLAQVGEADPASRIFAALTKTNVSGRCTKCHSIDASGDAHLLVNWQGSRHDTLARQATRFEHEPHFSLDNAERCKTCHVLQEQGFEKSRDAFLALYSDRAAAAAPSDDFAAMQSALCLSCHTGEAAGDDCASCHHYHRGRTLPVYLSSAAQSTWDPALVPALSRAASGPAAPRIRYGRSVGGARARLGLAFAPAPARRPRPVPVPAQRAGFAPPGAGHEKVGAERCGECHKKEFRSWNATSHASLLTDSEDDEVVEKAEEIPERLEIDDIEEDAACRGCHFSHYTDFEGDEQVTSVECESCHGAGADWVDVHSDYGSKDGQEIEKAADEDPAHREQRIKTSKQNGMLAPDEVVLVTRNCLGCHTGPDERTVNIGGHTPGSADFELVSWLSGEVRHNFHRTNQGANAEISTNRRRQLYVIGRALELEYALRGLSGSTQDGTYLEAMKKRVGSAKANLQEISAATSLPEVKTMLSAAAGVSLAPNNQAQALAAADRIHQAARDFAAAHDGSKLGALDAQIPSGKKGSVSQGS